MRVLVEDMAAPAVALVAFMRRARSVSQAADATLDKAAADAVQMPIKTRARLELDRALATSRIPVGKTLFAARTAQLACSGAEMVFSVIVALPAVVAELAIFQVGVQPSDVVIIKPLLESPSSSMTILRDAAGPKNRKP